MKKVLYSALIGVGAFAIVGGAVALANTGNGIGMSDDTNGYDRMIEAKAEIFGMTVDELKAARETKNFEEIAADQGVDLDDMHALMQDRAVSRWRDRGLTEDEIAERLALMQERHESGDGPHMGGLGFGLKGGGWRGQMHDTNGDGVCDFSEN